MTDPRSVAVALAVSLVLHAGLAVTLRGLGFGPRDEPASRPPLYVDLVEPVAVSSPRSGEATVAPRSADRPRGAREPRRDRAAIPIPPPAGPEKEDTGPGSVPPLPAPPAMPPPPIPSVPPPARSAAPPAPALVPPAEPAAVPPAPSAPHGNVAERMAARPEPEAGRRETSATTPAGGGASAGGVARRGGEIASVPGATGGAPGGSGGPLVDRYPASVGGGSESAALSGGRAGAIPPEYERYVRDLRRRIQERLRYPGLAVRQGLGGTVELEVRLDASGRLIGVAALGPAPAWVLREAAVEAVREATPFPFPPGLDARPLTIRLPIVFEIR